MSLKCRQCLKPISPYRPRRLCHSCYANPWILLLYKPAQVPVDLSGLNEPTRALPGTPEKMEVLTKRAARREALFHPDDAHWPTYPEVCA